MTTIGDHLVGRTAEMAAVDDALGVVRAGSTGSWSSGEPGIGKTRLLAELAARADAAAARCSRAARPSSSATSRSGSSSTRSTSTSPASTRGRSSRCDGDVRIELARVFPVACRSPRRRAGAPGRALPRAPRGAGAARAVGGAPSRSCWRSTTCTGPTRPRSSCSVRCCAARPPRRVLLALAARPRQLPERLAAALERADRAGR